MYLIDIMQIFFMFFVCLFKFYFMKISSKVFKERLWFYVPFYRAWYFTFHSCPCFKVTYLLNDDRKIVTYQSNRCFAGNVISAHFELFSDSDCSVLTNRLQHFLSNCTIQQIDYFIGQCEHDVLGKTMYEDFPHFLVLISNMVGFSVFRQSQYFNHLP